MPITSDTFMLLNVADGDSGGGASSALFYYLDKSRQHFYKFYTQDGKYSYTPKNIILYPYQISGTIRSKFTGTIKIYSDDSNIINDVFSSNDEIKIDLASITSNIDYFTIELVIGNNIVYSQVIDVDYGTSQQMARFAVGATDVTASVDNASIKFNSQGIIVNNGQFTIKNNGITIFEVDTTNHKLKMTGDIYTDSGQIGGWIISQNGIYSANKTTGLFAINDNETVINSKNLRIWSGRNQDVDNNITYQFYVTDDGYVYAKNANIQGTINVVSGNISGDLIVGTTSDGIKIHGGEDGYISTSNFSSGALGSGWKLNNDGSANFTNAYISGTITSSVFEYDTTSSVGGNLYISPTITSSQQSNSTAITQTKIILNQGTSSEYSYVVNAQVILKYENQNNNLLSINKLVIISGNFQKAIINENQEIINYDSIVNKYYIGIITNVGTNNTVTIQYNGQIGKWLTDTAIIDKDKGLLLTATQSNSPYIDIYDKAISATNPRVRLGNLNGLNNANFDSIGGYGLYSDNVFLTGQLILPNAGITNKNTYYYTNEKGKKQVIRLWAGREQNTDDNGTIISYGEVNSANFIVTQQGTMIAKQGIFNGTVNATDSTFSGVIRAAGIVIDNTTTQAKEADNDHFFVAYSSNPSNDDYIINIDKKGLSIWQGGLHAYSDSAIKTGNSDIEDIYGYDKNNQNRLNPIPYMQLIDDYDADNETLQARLTIYKSHFIQVNKNETTSKYYGNSIVIDNGIWFGMTDNIDNFDAVQNFTYLNTDKKNVGIQYSSDNESINIKSNNINLNALETINTNSQIKIQNYLTLDGEKQEITFGNNNTIIKQHITESKQDDETISYIYRGIDFIVT